MSGAPSAHPAVNQSAEEAALTAGVRIRLFRDLPDMTEAEALFERVWGPGGVTVPLLRSLALTDNYVAGAWAHDQLIGASVAIMSASTERRTCHLHIMGVLGPAQGSGVGFALMCHQRAWAIENGVDEITWMFDPLVRRNGWFATVKIGAKAVAYYPDFFGYLNDPVNRWDYTDRCLARWEVGTAPAPAGEPAEAEPGEGTLLILAEDETGQPVLAEASWPDNPPATLFCQVPADAHNLRQTNPKLAREWLSALRGTLGRAIEAGYEVTSMTRSGRYVLTRRQG
jgi:predicted GNAT superfamily acetyltransferase